MTRNAYAATLLVIMVSFCFHVQAQEMPKDVHEALNKIAGEWTSKAVVGDKEYDQELVAEWSKDGKTLIYQWKGNNFITGKSDTGTGMLGWNSEKKIVVEHSFSSQGEVMHATHQITKGDSWDSPTYGFTIVDGSSVFWESTRTIKWTSNQEFVVSTSKRFIGGKVSDGFTNTFKRK